MTEMRSYLVECGMCRRPCIPLADYDTAVCIGCEDAVELVLARARLVEPVLAATIQEPAPAELAVLRPYESYFGPADPSVIRDLVAEMFPRQCAKTPAARAAAPALPRHYPLGVAS